jgi:polyisoprenyl-teichoic acid--peptidoglycan teichoic acid transferase
MIAFGSLAMVLALTGYAGEKFLTDKVNSALPNADLLGNDVAKGNTIKGAINILLVGLDTRPANPSMGSRSDSIIIAHIPPTHDRVYMVSIPRDTNAYIPADKKTGWNGGDMKINAAFYEGSMKSGGMSGGFQLLAETIKHDYGISFNGGAIVDFDGFSDIVKKLGGVTLNVDEKTTSIHHGYLIANPKVHAAPYVLDPNCGCPKYGFNHPIAGVKPVVYNVGVQKMSAYEALDYVRIRDGLVGTDYARQRHQQQFLKAMTKEMFDEGLSNPTKLLGFLNSLGKAISFDSGGVKMTDWIFTLKGISPSSIVTIKTNDGEYDHYSGTTSEARQQLNPTSLKLLKSVVDDTMDQFVAQYPNWVATS